MAIDNPLQRKIVDALKGQSHENSLCFYWYHWKAKKNFTPVLLSPLLKILSFSCLIFDYKKFGGDFLLSHFSVNDSCYGSDDRAKKACVNKNNPPRIQDAEMRYLCCAPIYTGRQNVYTGKIFLVNSAQYEASNGKIARGF
jgi:hypothetical protein